MPDLWRLSNAGCILVTGILSMSEILSSAEIGRKIKAIRKRLGVSQEKLAELVGVSFQQIQKYESGANRLNTDKLQVIASRLSVPVAAFFENQPIEALPFTEQERNLMQSFRAISDCKIKDSIFQVTVFAGEKK
jgi:transcriptional regulator with XRE-family HTH domain